MLKRVAFTVAIFSMAGFAGCEKASTKTPEADEEAGNEPKEDFAPDEADEAEEEGEESAPGLDKAKKPGA